MANKMSLHNIKNPAQGNIDWRESNMSKNDFAPKQFSTEELKEARQRRQSSPNRGNNEEYAGHIIEMYKDYDGLRRRAGCLHE